MSKRITNQEVIEMVSLGLSDDVIIDKIHTTEETEFDTSLPGLKTLKAANVSDAVIRAMINPNTVAPTVNNRPAVLTAETSGVPWEIGFLPPGVQSASLSSSGKMYTFGVIKGERTPTSSSFSPGQGSVQGVTTTLENPGPPGPQVAVGSIGVFSDENPKVRHDGVSISRIASGGPANRAGIQAGDVILAIDDHYLFTAEELTGEIRGRKPGTRVAIRYRRHATIYDT